MNRVKKALFELRADMARNPGDLEDAELDYLLTSLREESDRNLAAVAELFDFDLEALEERAAIIEHDGGSYHVTANRQAVTLALQSRYPELSDRAARWLFNNAGAAMDWGRAHGATRLQTLQTLRECLEKSGQSAIVAENALSGRMAAS